MCLLQRAHLKSHIWNPFKKKVRNHQWSRNPQSHHHAGVISLFVLLTQVFFFFFSPSPFSHHECFSEAASQTYPQSSQCCSIKGWIIKRERSAKPASGVLGGPVRGVCHFNWLVLSKKKFLKWDWGINRTDFSVFSNLVCYINASQAP